ncbi:Valine--tRNA ligase, mitochondrial 1 [Cardamine amara subsp. amara]|uniref:Valine--tRNA ligase, mitochondrial n=1 Tax=Cardamine amara subsp. amara TaxID=228776 RepID=A0ABD0ZMW7_CARAN
MEQIFTEKDLERKKKNEEKRREKELKKQKALEKAELAQLKAEEAEQDGTESSKKSKKKSVKRCDSEENPQDFIDPETPFGEKKRLSSLMAKAYSPVAVEKSWYEWWEQSGFFKADAKSSKPAFVIILPPPNVTGILHTGHALTSAVEDTIIRWKRMSGFNTLWIPGVDHAGIATQVVVEKYIKSKRGLSRHDLGREEFIKEVWKWKNQSGGTIMLQQRRLGASLDWSRECFTMDEQRSKAVTEAFVRLYKEGLIYRDNRMVNWDCSLRSAISKDEVTYIEIKERTLLEVPGYKKPVEFGLLTSFAYLLEDGSGEIIVATTRVETMLGDTAIAVHPDDARYKHLHGKFAVHPFINGRKLPIICDEELVDPNFGTGCVKITPAHDPNDFAVGKRHNLEFINIFTEDGKINSDGGPEFTGMLRFTAREAVVEALRKKGLYRGAKNNEMRLERCSRTNDIIEPMIKPQWYVNCQIMGKKALDVAINDENKKLEFIQKQYTAEWRRWLENTHDWCISRQLWWGHRIPAWYTTLEEDQLKDVGSYNDHWIVARSEEEAQKEANHRFSGKKFALSRDPDVLDTWFSSALSPLSNLGWPDETDDLKAFYPTSVLETGHDILFFWVARMVMLCMQLSGDVPFNKVYMHPMIRDAHGRKMSKSLGNGIDPLEVINGETLAGLHKRLENSNLDPNQLLLAKEGNAKDFPKGIPECGADALRFALVCYTAQSDRINMDIKQVNGYREWCNKLWNAVRFAMINLGDGYTPLLTLHPETMPLSCQWILSVLNNAISKTVDSLNAYDFSDAANTVHHWWKYQFCDVYIEVIKPYFTKPEFGIERAHAQHVLWICLETGLRLLHPFMPFVTEELWQRLPWPKDCERKASIMICDYPSPIENWRNEKAETAMEIILMTKTALNAKRETLQEKPKKERLQAFALCENEFTFKIVQSHELEIITLAYLSSLEVVLNRGGEQATLLAGSAFEIVNENLKVYFKVDEAIDEETKSEKIRKTIDDIQKQIEKLRKIMSGSGYEEKVPANIKEDNMTKLTKLLQELGFFNDL